MSPLYAMPCLHALAILFGGQGPGDHLPEICHGLGTRFDALQRGIAQSITQMFALASSSATMFAATASPPQPQRVGDLQAHGVEGGEGAGDEAEGDGEKRADDQFRDGMKKTGSILRDRAAAERDEPRDAEPGEAAEHGDEARLDEDQQRARGQLVKPIALSTPISSVRSRTDWLIVLPATSRMVKKTALDHAGDDRADVADLLTRSPAANAPSGSALVSYGELANSSSIAAATSAAWSGVFHPHAEPADLALALLARLRRSSRSGKRRAVSSAPFFAAVVDADDLELPLRLPGRLAPDRRGERDAVADLPASIWPSVEGRLADDRAGARV